MSHLSDSVEHRFDWYQASFPDDARVGALDLLAPLGDERPRRDRATMGYTRAWEVRRDGRTLCRVLEAPALPDHVVVTGSDAPEIARVLRSRVPAHRVSRADVAMDFRGGEQFWHSTAATVRHHLTGSVVITEYRETGLAGESATLYVGARSSETRVRLYEKGKQDDTYEPDTVRIEIQARPKKERRDYCARIAPDAYWGLSRWSGWLADEVASVGAPAAPPRSARVSDLEGAMLACINTYGQRILEWLRVEHGGDPEGLGVELVRRCQERYG